MPNVKFVQFDINTCTQDLLEKFIRVYQEVFADPPWNEWLHCPICHKHWGIEQKAEVEALNFQHCHVAMEEFWPHDTVESDLRHELEGKSSCWLAFLNDRVIGFCFGYGITPEKLEEKLKLPGCAETIKNNCENAGTIAYHDDLGVLNEFRKLGVAKKLFELHLNDMIAQGLKFGIGRTKQSDPPSVTYVWFKRIGYQVIDSYPPEDGRVIMACTMNQLNLLNKEDQNEKLQT